MVRVHKKQDTTHTFVLNGDARGATPPEWSVVLPMIHAVQRPLLNNMGLQVEVFMELEDLKELKEVLNKINFKE